jgi:hypothetical protein
MPTVSVAVRSIGGGMMTKRQPMCVVEGNPITGFTIWGPFDSYLAAEKWSDCNPKTDLSTNWIAELHSPEDDMEE